MKSPLCNVMLSGIKSDALSDKVCLIRRPRRLSVP